MNRWIYFFVGVVVCLVAILLIAFGAYSGNQLTFLRNFVIAIMLALSVGFCFARFFDQRPFHYDP